MSITNACPHPCCYIDYPHTHESSTVGPIDHSVVADLRAQLAAAPPRRPCELAALKILVSMGYEWNEELGQWE